MFRGNLLFFISCVAIATAFECGRRVAPTRHKRIVNGDNAGHWPWMVLLLSDPDGDGLGMLHCGGSVIGSRWVLTAAHCVQNVSASWIHMIIGETDIRDFQKSKVYRHAASITLYDDLYKYDDENRFRAERIFDVKPNDVAIIELDQSLDFTEHIRPICLPSRVDPIYKKGAELVAIGHGNTRPYDASNHTLVPFKPGTLILQEMKHIAEDPAQCKERLLRELEERFEEEEENDDFDRMALMDEKMRLNICMKEKGKVEGMCQGDSGGPLMLKAKDNRWFQFGITSHGTSSVCAQSTAVDVFANTVMYCKFFALATNGEVNCIDVKA